jgi:hypothetical protein
VRQSKIAGNSIKFQSPNSTAILNQNSFDFSSIRDNFRQHIQNRSSTDSSNLVLLDEQLLLNLKTLKEKSFEILQKFSKVRGGDQDRNKEVRKFTSFEEFVNFVVQVEEIFNAEIWKLEAIANYLEELQHLTGLNGS